MADPAGPLLSQALDALRTHLNEEEDSLAEGLAGVFGRLQVGARCAVVCHRLPLHSAVRRFVRGQEDCDPSLVADWPPGKAFALFPLLGRGGQDWCVREVAGSAALDLLPIEEE